MLRKNLEDKDGLVNSKMKYSAYELQVYDSSLSEKEKLEHFLLSANLGYVRSQGMLFS